MILMEKYKEEYIGRYVKVQKCFDLSKANIEGYILDESKSTFIISTNKGIKIVPKKGTVFYINDLGEILGDSIISRLEDRIKFTKRDIDVFD